MRHLQEFIKQECFSIDWVQKNSKKLKGDPTLVEKTIHAFALLGYLVQLEENFVFKGGTSLLLHIPQIKRLSIDIDIVLGDNINEFIKNIESIPGNPPFIRLEENKRGFRGLPNRRHFKFFYNSLLTEKEEFILLDVVLDNPAYIPFTEMKQIRTNLFEIQKELQVKVPTIEGLIGDKLTAFAPNTIGVPFVTEKEKSMTMQVIKQLYDIGELFDIASSFDNIKMAFNATFEKENEYRNNAFSKNEVLQDTIDTCLTLLQIQLKGFIDDSISLSLKDGIKKIDSHLLDDKFDINSKAKITAAKVFCIANLLMNDKTFDFSNDMYQKNKIEILGKINLPMPYNRLNKLKAILPEAFYYVWQGIK